MQRDHELDLAAERREMDDLAPGVPTEPPISARGLPQGGAAGGWGQNLPFLQLVAYYLLLIALVLLLTNLFPDLRRAFFMPVTLPAVSGERALLTGAEGAPPPVLPEATVAAHVAERSLSTLLVTVGALLLVLPVTGVYMRTQRLRYDPALVRSVVILPIVVAGIAVVVKNSIALAFSLAGIVAAVRFRNTLKDPRDAVYIFLVIGIGLSAGVQALDVALVTSLVFNFVVLFLWRFNIGSIYGGSYGRTGVISAGSPALLLARDPGRRRAIRLALLEEAETRDTDGVLLVHTGDPELARGAVQEAMGAFAREWHLARIVPRGHGFTTLEYLVQLRKKASPTDLVGALEEHWSRQVPAAEYFSLLLRGNHRDEDAEED